MDREAMTWPTAEAWVAIASSLGVLVSIAAYAVKLILRRNAQIRELEKELYEVRVELAANQQGDKDLKSRVSRIERRQNGLSES